VKRTFLVSMLLVAVFALASERALADEITVGGTTASNTPTGITFTTGSFNGMTSGGFAGFSNLGLYGLTCTSCTFANVPVDFQITFTVPAGISGNPSTFVANLFGNVNSNNQGGADIVFATPTQNYTFTDSSGSGSFSFTVNNVSINPSGTTAVSGFVSGGSFTPVPEPSSMLLLGAGLLLTPFLGLKRLCRS
jgi:hypothetical protein